MHTHGPDCGCDLHTLAKAVGPLGEGSAEGEGEDPRFEALWRLVQAARRDWRRWGDRLVGEVTRRLQDGSLLPLTRENEEVLLELLRAHEDALVLRLAGAGVGESRIQELVDQGLVHPDVRSRSYLERSYRVGRTLEQLAPVSVGKAGRETVAEVLKRAAGLALDQEDRQALSFVMRRGAQYMRSPADILVGDVTVQLARHERALNEAEISRVQGAVARGYAERKTVAQVARDLREAAEGTRLTNNMDRVARTELVYAHNHGAKQALKVAARQAGDDAPRVYKMISPFACQHCKRIWGLPGSPKVYTLAEVERNDAEGGNFGRRAADWRATTGPIHPNCTCGPLHYYHPTLTAAIQEASAELAAMWGD